MEQTGDLGGAAHVLNRDWGHTDQGTDSDTDRSLTSIRGMSDQRGEKQGLTDKQDEEADGTENEEEDEEEEEETESEFDEPPEMTDEERKAMYYAVKEASIDDLEALLDFPNADINMLWFNENLLMAAIKSKHQDVAEFLIDNGIDRNFETTTIQFDPYTKKLDWTTKSCRQVAYEHNMPLIVELIDQMNGHLWPFVKPEPREPRLRRSPSERCRSMDGESIDDSDSDDSTIESDVASVEEIMGFDGIDTTDLSRDDGEPNISKRKQSKRKKRKKSNSHGSEIAVECNDNGQRNEKGGKDEDTQSTKTQEPENHNIGETGTDDKKSSVAGSDDGYQTASVTLSDTMSESRNAFNLMSSNVHRKTKTYLSRRRENVRTICDLPLQNSSRRKDSSVYAPGSYKMESRLWTPDKSDMSHSTRFQIPRQTVSPTRIISPYKEDDPVLLHNWKKQQNNVISQPLSSYSVHVQSKAELLRLSTPKQNGRISYHRQRSSTDVYTSPARIKNLPEIMLSSQKSNAYIKHNNVNSVVSTISTSMGCGVNIPMCEKRPSPAGLMPIKKM